MEKKNNKMRKGKHMWSIKAIKAGEIYGDYSLNVVNQRMGNKLWVPSMVWFLTDGKQQGLFDTGFGNPVDVASKQTLFQVRRDKPLSEILQVEACPPEEIDFVILSHLHWDHCADLELFSKAELYLQWRELEFALNPPAIFAGAYDSPSIGRTPSWLNKRFNLLDGDFCLFPGLRVIYTPGHTLGHQSLIVETKKGHIGLAADLFPLYANIEGDGDGHFLPNVCLDYLSWITSAEKFARQCDVILPSHDPKLTTAWMVQ